jgi:hypothetical protein
MSVSYYCCYQRSHILQRKTSTYQAMHIINCHCSSLPPLAYHAFIAGLVMEQLVQRARVLSHRLRRLRLVHRFCLLAPEARAVDAAERRVSIQRCQVKRREIEEDEISAPEFVERVEGGVDASDVVGEGFAEDLGVGEEGVVAQVVCTCCSCSEKWFNMRRGSAAVSNDGRRELPIHIA